MLGLVRHQPLGMAGAIEQQVGGEIFGDVVLHRFRLIDDALHDAVGKTRQRHGQRLDELTLRAPFRRDHLGQCARRHNDRAAGRRLDRLTVERDGVTAVGLADAGVSIKPLALNRAGRAPRRFHRVGFGLARDVVEQFAHGHSALVK